MFFRSKKKSDTPKFRMPFFVQIAVLLLVGYVLFNDYSTKSKKVVESGKQIIHQIKTQNALINDIAETEMRRIQLKKGDGITAYCGDLVKILLKTRKKDGTVLQDTFKTNSPLSFTLGENTTPLGISRAVHSMNVGEVQQVLIPAKLNKTLNEPDSPFPISTEIALVEVQTKRPYQSEDGLLSIQTHSQTGDPLILSCGDPISFTYRLYSEAGTLVKEQQNPVNTTIGSTNIPASLSRALLNLHQTDGTIVIPADYIDVNDSKSLVPLQVKKPAFITLSVRKSPPIKTTLPKK